MKKIELVAPEAFKKMIEDAEEVLKFLRDKRKKTKRH